MPSPLSVVLYSAPVAIAALGETITQLGGVINIGLEGMMLMGCYAGTVVTLSTHAPYLGLAAGVGVGIACSLLQGVFTVRLATDQVATGTAINLLAIGVTGTLFRQHFGQSGELLRLPPLAHYAGADLVLFSLIAIVPALWWLVNKTEWGLSLRACGEYPNAVVALGRSVVKQRMTALAIGGAFAGLAGAYLAIGVAGSFAERMTSGRGFMAIALVTFGRWKPQYVALAALLIGYTDSLQYTLQGAGTGIPYQFVLALPYVVALVVLAVAGSGAGGPQALGLPFKKRA